MEVSMKEVASRAGVSTTTVSHVINATRPVKEETRERVLKAISELSYRVNPAARNLRSGSSKIIGYVASNLANYFFMDIAIIIDRILSEKGYHLIFSNSNEDPDKEQENLENLIHQNVDGLIIAPVREECGYMKDLVGEHTPAVFFDRMPGGIDRDCIMVTNRDGAYLGTEHLISKGFKKIGFIGSRTDATMGERIEGYRKALNDYGLDFDETLVMTGSGDPLVMEDEKHGESYEHTRILVEEKGIDAIMAGNAVSVLGAFNYLKDSGLSLSDRIGLFSFDDPFWLSMSERKISAVYQDKDEIGRMAAETLLKRIDGDSSPWKTYRLPTKIILRDNG